jgi:CRISPR-associated endonuclease/helicase Cas3
MVIPKQEIILSGLDGSNPLAFLAALGTLRLVSFAHPGQEAELSWAIRCGTWKPSLHLSIEIDQSSFVQLLHDRLERDVRKHPIAFVENMAGIDAQKLRQMFTVWAREAELGSRGNLDWLSAMCSDMAAGATSQLQTVRRDYFWGNLESILKLTTSEHLQRTLFEPWDYADPLDNQSLHFEPSEDRRHAHQWNKPSGDPMRKKRGGMLGANRLAIEAFPFFQSIAAGDRLSTCGFSGNRSDNTRWTWPIWSYPANAYVVGSLLALSELQRETPDTKQLLSRGLPVAFRCRRTLVEKTPNFTAAQPV